jgi:hypothetical protein
MSYTADTNLIRGIWDSLNGAPLGYRMSGETRRIEKMIDDGWIGRVNFGDLVEDHDSRLGGIDIFELATAMEIPVPHIYRAPRRKTVTEVMGFQMITVADAANLMIKLERLGFRVDPAAMVASALELQRAKILLTDSEMLVRSFDRDRHRYWPLTIATGKVAFPNKTHELKTAAGYKVTYVEDEAGTPVQIGVGAPEFRRKPDPVLTRCPDCGMSYMKGLLDDGIMHRKNHTKVMATRDPKPLPRAIEALAEGWTGRVDATSPRWMHDEVYGRAREFKRDEGYDFVQWADGGERDGQTVGHLFVDTDGSLQGASCFRKDNPGGATLWRLDWIWLAPGARRQGRLAAKWPDFLAGFGRFRLERPLSRSMEAFLAKHGDPELLPA